MESGCSHHRTVFCSSSNSRSTENTISTIPLVSNSLMTFGAEDHRVQVRSARRMEVRCLLLICFSVYFFFFFLLTCIFSMCFCFSDLDSAVSSGGLDQILTPPAGQIPNQPSTRSFFQSVTVTKVVKPDGVRGTVFCESPNGATFLPVL